MHVAGIVTTIASSHKPLPHTRNPIALGPRPNALKRNAPRERAVPGRSRRPRRRGPPSLGLFGPVGLFAFRRVFVSLGLSGVFGFRVQNFVRFRVWGMDLFVFLFVKPC